MILSASDFCFGRDANLSSLTVDVINLGILPTPVNYFSMFHLDLSASVQVTGSHNPPEFNGFKMSLNKKPFYGKDIQSLHNMMMQMDFEKGEGTEARYNILSEFVDYFVVCESKFDHRGNEKKPNFVWRDNFDRNKKHISLYLQFNDKYLIYEDTRKFGRFYMYENMDILNNKLGIEPLSDIFSKNWLIENMKLKKRQIKSLLFDQSFICGLGNIYIDESLWRAKIHPLALSNKISKAKIIDLHSSIVKVLSDSIKLGGSTIRDYTYDFAYVGNYALNLKVFGKDGHKCPRCDNIITKIKVAQRGTHYCKKCQRK